MPVSLWILIVMIAAAAFWAARSGNWFRGIGTAAVCSLLLPTWCSFSLLGIEADSRVAVAIALAAFVTVCRPRWVFDRLVVADVIVVFLCLWQTTSEWNAGGLVLKPFLLSYGYWVLPYFVGRCSARSIGDLRWLGFVLSGVCVVFAITSCVENVTGMDLFQEVFGSKPSLPFHGHKGTRWGFVRCEGPYRHPIFFGTVCLLTLPWTVWLTKISTAGNRLLARAGLVSSVIATANTISRGPILALFVSVFTAIITNYRKVLLTTLCFSGVLLGGLVAKPNYLQEAGLWFARMSGEYEKPIALGDEVEITSSSMTRLLIVKHYWKAVTNAGMMGYGMVATDSFPPNIPHVPFDQVTQKQFSVVDNTYVLLTLRGGWLLSLGFVVLLIAAIAQFRGLEKGQPTLKILTRMMMGTLCAFALIVFTVYPDFDFMFVFLWTVGVSSILLDETKNDGWQENT